jgi:hypothetical protein
MRPNKINLPVKLILLVLAGTALSASREAIPDVLPVQATATDTVCRFGITSPFGSEGYDIASTGVGAYLDWSAVTNPSLPDGVEYIHVVRLRDDLFPQMLANLPAWVQANPGDVWVVGNEPDTIYGGQDALLPEVYADRYYELARIIRTHDPSALIGFGSVVQPTPIRIRYLERAWNQLATLSGGFAGASRMVDFWAIHSFILNEQVGSWGTGIPRGFENDHGDAVEITDFSDTYSITLFQQRITAFRNWMANIRERDKPLWITEYGSLFPPIDPPDGPNYYNVSDEDTRDFMLATFDFMLTTSNDQTGLPGDHDQLVQRWFWYSLNDHRYIFGGSIFDPDNGNIPTVVGEGLIDYQATNLAQPDLYPAALSIASVSYNHESMLVNYRVDVTLGNYQFPDASCAQVWIYDGDPEDGGTLIAGPIPASAIRSDFGTGKLSVYWKEIQPLTYHTIYVVVNPIGVPDVNPTNNRASFDVYLDLPILSFLTTIYR